MIPIKRKSISVLIMVILCICIFSPGSFAKESPIKNYDYEEIMTIYVNSSSDIAILELENQQRSLELEELKKDTRSSKSKMNSRKQRYENNKKSDSTVKKEEYREEFYESVGDYAKDHYELELLQFQIENEETITHHKIALKEWTFKDLLWQHYLLESRIALLEDTCELYNQVLDLEKEKFNIGMGTALEMKEADMELQLVVNQTNILRNMQDMLQDKIKIEAGLPMDEELNIRMVAPIPSEPFQIPLSALRDSFYSRSMDIIQKQKEMEASKNKYDFLIENYGVYTDEYREGELEYRLTLINQQQYYNECNNMLINEFSKYGQATDNYKSSEEVYEVILRQYKDGQHAFEEGQLSKIEEQGLQLKMKQAKLEYEGVTIQYNMAIERLQLLFSGIAVELF